MADATYIEPITPEFVEKIIARERPNVPDGKVFALLPTMGGQTALNTALSLRKIGALERHNVELIGATADAIDKAEDRELLPQAMMKIGLDVPKGITLKGQLRHKKDAHGNFLYDGQQQSDHGAVAGNLHQGAGGAGRRSGLPAVIRPSFTLGGTGGGIAYNREEFFDIVEARARRLAHQRSADRGIGARLEGIRDGSRARPRRQRHHHLLHRECRPDGRAYRRFHHGRPRPDADRQGISAHALRLDRGAARDRGGDRRLECAVRGESRRTAAWSSSR